MKLINKLFFLLILIYSNAISQPLPDSKKDTWKGFERTYFTINQHSAYYVKPAKALPGNPWIWRSAFPDWHTEIDSLLLQRGFHVAYISVENQYGSPYAMQTWDQFYNYLTGSVKLSPQPALEAVSRGTIYVMSWAKRNPDKVSCIYAETPVYDLKSWPGAKGRSPGDAESWKQFKDIFHLSEQQAIDFNDNPYDNLEGLAAFKVPVLNVIGINDTLAPREENTDIFIKRYTELGGPAAVYPVTEGPQSLHGHHFPIRHVKAYADFVFSNSYPVKNRLAHSSYYQLRNGLKNFAQTAVKQQKATVAFLGGSITYNPGWRQKITTYLQERFPKTEFKFIAAGIPSLGSLPHAFRLQRDLLDSGKVDLLFIEAAVNDRVNGTDSLTQVRALEGIVRHAKKTNPLIDIVMMAFADPDKNRDYDRHRIPAEITNHELIAEHYHLPSLNLAKEVHDRIVNQEFSWADDFKDVHPAVYGQELYASGIKSLLNACFDEASVVAATTLAITATTTVAAKTPTVAVKTPTAAAKTPTAKTATRLTGSKTTLPKELDPYNFSNGSYYDIKNAKSDANWKINTDWTPKDQADTRPGFVHVPVLSAEKPGATLSISFKGTAIGIAVISGPDAGTITYSVDGAAKKQIDLFTPWSNWLHLPWYLLLEGGLKNGSHVLNISIDNTKNTGSKGNACRIVYFLKN